MNISKCLKIVNAIHQDDADKVLEKLDAYRSAGLSPRDAELMAVKDAIADHAKERQDMIALVNGHLKEAPAAKIAEIGKDAATSPDNDRSHPSAGQTGAGNYKKVRVPPRLLHGLEVTIENPAGSVRVAKDGSWASAMPNHYGYIRRTEGAYGDKVDTFIGPKPESKQVFIIDQMNPKTGEFDEHKVMLGFDSQEAAEAGYKAAYPSDWKGMGTVSATTIDGLKEWLKTGDTKMAYAGGGKPAASNISAAAMAVRKKHPGGIVEHAIKPDELLASSDKDLELLASSSDIHHLDRLAANTKPLTQREKRVVTGLIQRLLDVGMPRAFIGVVDNLVSMDSGSEGTYFWKTKTVGLDRAMLESAAVGDGEWIQKAAGVIAHEFWHAADEGEKSFHSGNAKSLKIGPMTDGRRRPVGAIAKEAYKAFIEHRDLRAYLEYPFRALHDAPANGRTESDHTTVLQNEVFAQLGALYRTNPKLLQRTMPKAFALFKDIHERVSESGDRSDGVESAVLEALRASGADGGNLQQTQLGRNQPADQGRLGVREARTGVGQDAGVGVGSAQVAGVHEIRRLPGRPFERGRGIAGQVRVSELTAPAKAKFALSPAAARIAALDGIPNVQLLEVPGDRGAAAFHAAISASKVGNKFSASVYVYDQAEYAAMRLFMTADGKAGFALKGDDIVSVFNNGAEKGIAHNLMMLAVQEGGRRLDAFDTVLPRIYAAHGFEPAARMAWNDEYAPDGWDKKRYEQYNGGEPDVVFMAYTGTFDPYQAGAGAVETDYDAAVSKQAGMISAKPDQLESRVSVEDGEAVVNIGLETNDGKGITKEEARRALKRAGVKIKAEEVRASKTEQTLVATIDRALTPDEAHKVAVELRQEAIAQKVGGVGEIYGPQAENWRPFNDKFFLSHSKSGEDALMSRHADEILARAAGPNLTKQELEVLKMGVPRVAKKRAQRFAALFDELPATSEYVHAALAGRAARRWYEKSRIAGEAMYGKDYPRFAALMAALSPQTDVPTNFYNAAQVWADWHRSGRPTDTKAIVEILNRNVVTPDGRKGGAEVMDAYKFNTIRALTHATGDVQLSGPKVESFRNNLIGNLGEVTNDRHVAAFSGILQELLGGTQIASTDGVGKSFGIKSPGYIAPSVRYRQAARELTKLTGETWAPAEVQETGWSFWRTLYNLATAQGETRSALQLIRDGALTHELIAETPTLGQYFDTKRYRHITRGAAQAADGDADAASRISAAERGATRETGPVVETPAIKRIAQRLDRLIKNRGRIEALKAEIKEQDATLERQGIDRSDDLKKLEDEIERIAADVDADQESAKPDMMDARVPEANDQTQTPEFNKWFGDSKVVDKNGKPLVVYHGTANDFAEFEPGEDDFIYLASHPEQASAYAVENGGRVIPAYVSLPNPTIFEYESTYLSPQAYWDDGYLLDQVDGDGVIVRNTTTGEVIVLATKSTQIKSAIGNNGNFDARKPSILESRVAEAEPLWYSQLATAVESKAPFAKDGTIPAGQLRMWLAARSKDGGIKAEEMKWSGLDEFLSTKNGRVSRDDVKSFLDQNGVRITETKLGEAQPPVGWVLSGPNDEMGTQRWKFSDGHVRGYGDTEQDAIIDAKMKLEREARRWQKNGDEEKAQRFFAQADEFDAYMEARAGMSPNGEETTKFSSYQLPGGENYRELLLTLPTNEGAPKPKAGDFPRGDHGTARYNAALAAYGANNFRSSHFDQPNILAHIRFNERTDAEGKRVLFIEEIQSDWAQKGRKEGFAVPAPQPEIRHVPKDAMPWHVYMGDRLMDVAPTRAAAESHARGRRNEIAGGAHGNVPVAPFVAKTEAWVALALKRMIRYAADNGFDRVAWTTGEQQAERYDLSKQISKVEYNPAAKILHAYDLKGFSVIQQHHVEPAQIADYVGKDAAEKLLNARLGPRSPGGNDKVHSISGDGLKVGGEGMRAFYDRIIPNVANDLLKKMGGGRVSSVALGNGGYGVQRVMGKGWQVVDARNLPVDDRTFRDQQEALRWIVENDPTRAQPGFDITPDMEPAASKPQMLFAKVSIAGDSGRAYTPEQKVFFKAAGREVETPTMKERVAALWKDAGKKMAQGLVDQFSPIKGLSSQAYTLARLSKGSAGAFEALLKHGKLKIRDGVYDADVSGGVIEKVFAPLQGEGEDFLWWIAANRAERLTKEDRENLFTAADIQAGKSLASGQTPHDYTLQNGPRAGQVTRDRAAIYEDALKSFDAFNRNVMDMAEQSGLIDGQGRRFWEHEFYVPFYRSSDETGVRGVNVKSGLVRQEAFKKLKGGSDKLNSDLLANTLQNWAHLIDASAKNRAARATLEAASTMRLAVEAPESTIKQMSRSLGMRKNTAWFLDAGNQRFFLVEDPYVLAAINGLEFAGLRGPLMDAMSTFKHWLTVSVTASPFFKVRNLIRDSVQAIATSGLSYNPLGNIKEGFQASNHETQLYASMLASGAVIHFGTMLESRESDRVRQLSKQGVKSSTIINNESAWRQIYDKYIEPGISAYNELGNRSEEINRAALYKQLTDQGMDHATAALMARDLLDFSMQGAWTSVRFLTQVVPFLNARIQGLYKLGRASKDDPVKIAVTLGAVALASVALLMAYKDDDDWKKREDWDRDSYWWFKIGGVAYRIPKPFEIGAIASVAERGVELLVSDEMNGKRFTDRMLALLSDNLSMNPVPQMVKPVLDVYANKESFTGRPIENMAMERLRPEERYTQNTSMFARAASKAGNAATGIAGKDFLSPVQIDALTRGYFSWLGAFVVAGTDMIIRPLSGQPSRPSADLVKLASGGMAAQLPEQGNRYISEMYDQATRMERAYATWRDMLKQRDPERAAAFAAQHQEEISRYKLVERVKRAESQLNTRAKLIQADKNLSPDEKREMLERINEQRGRSAMLLAAGLRNRAVQSQL